MKYSIIIATARGNELDDCLLFLEKQTLSKDKFEIIVLTDGEQKIKKNDLNVKLFPLPAKSHPSFKRNFGVNKSQWEILCFLDDDTQVPTDWLEKISEITDKNPEIIISGPNLDKRKEFKYRIANALQKNFLTEGLISHSSFTQKYIFSDHHNMPLCNLVIPRKIYERINGFNEIADYFMDDVEFCYIASKLKYQLRLYPQLEIQHNLRPLFLPYFKYKFRTRYKIGNNFILFPECYYQAKQIWLIGISYLFLLFLPYLIKLNFFWETITIFLGIYFLVILISTIKHFQRPWEGIIVFSGTILVHLLSWLGFTIGLIKSILQLIFNHQKSKTILDYKKIRYQIFKDENH